MAKRVQLRRGTTPQTSIFTGAIGEVTVDTDKDVLVVHDGATAGGFPAAARANADGTISLIKKDGASAGVINATGLFNDTLTSTNTNQALTAAQGKVLQDNKLDKTAITVSGSAPMFACRAWVNFNGTGTPTIRASGNVSSITDNGVGNYSINFITAMPDTNYALSGFATWTDAQAAGLVSQTSSYLPSVNYVPIRTVNSNTGSGFYDPSVVTVAVFR